MSARNGSRWRGWGVAVWIAAAPCGGMAGEVTAAEVGASAQGGAGSCDVGTWRLTGAAYRAGDGQATVFIDAWNEPLREAAACIEQADRGRCLEVQGQYDARPFHDSLALVAGSDTAAQVLRARARGQVVASRLHELGVPAFRLVERPPGLTSTWAGTLVRLSHACPHAAPPLEAPLAPPPARASLRDELAAVAETPIAEREVHTVERRGRGELWLQAGTALDVVIHDPASALGARVGLGLGWHGRHAYARAFSDLALADEPAERVGLDFGAALGGRPTEWLGVGLFARHRVVTRRASDPWLEQGWSVGLESTQRLAEWSTGTSLWAIEGFAPLGQGWRRALVADDEVRPVSQTRYDLMRLFAGVAIQQEL